MKALTTQKDTTTRRAVIESALKRALQRLVAVAALVAGTAAAAANDQEASFDGLVPVEGARVPMAYIDPEADFSVFQRLAILDPVVRFRANWVRDQNRGQARRTRSVTQEDAERIKSDLAALFREVLVERLEANDGYEVVDVTGEDVLLLRPAIIDLDVTSPDTRNPGRSRSYATTAGSATLYIELYDSISGDILGRAADRQTIRRSGGTFQWNTSVTNSVEARRLLGEWADLLRSFLDSHYQG